MTITDQTRKLLWGRSGRSCAICKCDLFIDATIASEASVVGDECHIVSGQPDGPRYDPTFAAELIDHVSNLLLLCKVHHKMVDDQRETYLAEVLHTIKADHEQWVRLALVAATQSHLDASQRNSEVNSGRTFVSHTVFFAAKAPRMPNPLLDFSLPLYGRTDQLRAIESFLESESESIAILNGRGGLGKSKLLHDGTASLASWSVVFLKDAPLWHPDSAREIPLDDVIIVVDDAHRASTLPSVIELFRELRARRNVKLLLSTRPGGVLELERQLYKSFGSSEVLRLPDLEELTDEQSEVLAKEILGEQFSIYATELARVSDNSPLVIVAGGHLIVAHQITPAEISGIEDFRRMVFTRFYDELKLSGPDFAINPPRPLLQIIAAIGPVDAASESFLSTVETFLECASIDILTTLDALAAHGVITPRSEPVRIVPDVLSDYVLETACVNIQRLSTGYADRIFDSFGDHFFQKLMQNLSELDWRLGRVGRGLDLLNSVWNKIYARFREEDTHRRRKLLEELRPAAVYQPGKILELVRLARTEPLVGGDIPARYRMGREYLLGVLPALLEATAHHADFLSRSVDILWELGSEEPPAMRSDGTAKGTLERLASYQRYKWPAFNFAMLLQAIRLCRRQDAFDRDFTPLNLVNEILEREGEFSEYRGNSISFGGFGLNPAAVAPVRVNAMQFLDSLLYSDRDIVAIAATQSLGRLLPNVLNRVGRESSAEELAWQQEERLKVIPLLAQRLSIQPLTLPVRRSIVHVLRTATGVHCTTEARECAAAELAKVDWDDDLLVFDAVCCRDGDFPITSTTDPEGSWHLQSEAQLALVVSARERRSATAEELAADLVAKVKLAYGCRLEPNGFGRIVGLFREDGDLLSALADRITRDPESEKLMNELRTVSLGLQSARPAEFRVRAREILARGVLHEVIGAAGALRVDADYVTVEDIELLESYIAFPNSLVKQDCLHSLAYLGKKPELQPALLRAVLSVEVNGDAQVASSLVGTFGHYGVQRSRLSETDVSHILAQLSTVDDLSINQGAIPRFLSTLTGRFPDQVLDFMLHRLEVEEERQAIGDWSFRGLGTPYGDVSFGTVEWEAKARLVETCLNRYLKTTSLASSYGSLLWTVIGGLDENVLSVLSRAAAGAEGERLEKLLSLIRTSPGRLVLGNPAFVKQFLRNLSGEARSQAVAAFVDNSYSLGSGAFAGGDPNQIMHNNWIAIAGVLSMFQQDDDMQDISEALAASEAPHYDFGSSFGLQSPTD